MVKSTLVSLLGTPELRLSLGSDSGEVNTSISVGYSRVKAKPRL